MNTYPTTATNPQNHEPRWLSVQEAAARWRCSPRTVERHLNRPAPGALRLGRVFRVNVLAVEQRLSGQIAPHEHEPHWLSLKDAAARWRCSPRTVERHLRRLGVAPLRLGSVVRVDVLAVERSGTDR